MRSSKESNFVEQGENKAISISPRQLLNLRNCEKAYEYEKLHIIYPHTEMLEFLKVAMDKLKNDLLNKATKDVIKDSLSKMVNQRVLQDWFSCEMEYEVQKANTVSLLIRFINYVFDHKFNLLKTDLEYQYILNPHLKFQGKEIHSIYGTIDFLFEDADNQKHAVILKYGYPVESYRARSEANLPEMSIELLAAHLGISKVLNEKVLIEMWYLRNKDDTSEAMISKFDHKKGKNIISCDFNHQKESQLYERLMYSLYVQTKCDCDTCCHKDVCKVPKKIRMDGCTNNKTNQVSNKKIFTNRQNEVITHVNKPLCVVAVPGAGKTTALVERLVHLITKCHVRPTRILMVTFTRKAVDEIRERVSIRLAEQGIKSMPVIATYNSLGFTILKENPLYIGGKVRLADDIDRYRLIFEALKQCDQIKDMSYVLPFGEHGIVRNLDEKFEELERIGEDVYKERYMERYDVNGIIGVYSLYRSLYKKGGYIDYSEQISMVNDLFDDYPSLKDYYAKRYEYLMIDEFQDSSEEQVNMVYSIARIHRNIVVVGDDDQSIYKWRGGSSKYMLHFKEDFNDAKFVYMEDNFRSNHYILELCNALIQGNGNRFEKSICAHSKCSHKPIYFKDVERTYLKDIVKQYLTKGGKQPGEIAILARNNKRLAEVEQLLEGVCPVSVPKDYLIKDTAFLAVYDMLKLFFEGFKNDLALYRVFRLLGTEELLNKKNSKETFYNNLIIQGLHPVMLNKEYMAYLEKKNDKLSNCILSILRCCSQMRYGQLQDAIHSIFSEILHVDHHIVEDAILKLADDRGIIHVKDLYEVMNNMVLYSATERVGYSSDPNAVNLLTIHDSKGKEFDTIIVYGMEDFSMEEEEVRVLYVALSRAKKNLCMLETAYNKYEGFERIAKYVSVKGGSYV